MVIGTFRRDAADVLDDPIERPLASAQRAHPVVRVAVAVERDLDAVQAVREQPIDHLRRQQQAVRDDRDRLRNAALRAQRVRALGQVVADRQVQQRLAAEQREVELLRASPRRDAARSRAPPCAPSSRRHLRGELVVVAVVALEAVVAREVALQRREHRHLHLLGVFAQVGEVLAQRRAAPRRGSRRRSRSRSGYRSCRVRRRRSAVSPRADPLEQLGDIGRDEQLRVREGVHQEHVVRVLRPAPGR